jgi:phosphoribosyl 1,2-cyclic phosphodiesterase
MNVKILASGSGGNCIAVRSGSTTILIDVGIAKTKIEKRLLDVGIRADEIDAIFITHAHGDHIKGLPIANKYQIDVYASEGEWKNLDLLVDDNLQYIATANHHLGVHSENDWLDITPFNVHHDAYEPFGYSILSSCDHKCSICLDTGKIDSQMLEAMRDSDIYIIEANHDPAMVESSGYPLSVQGRILSDIGHLSNEQTAAALKQLVRGNRERVYLTHLSSKNNTPQLAERTIKLALFDKGLVAGKHYFLEVF